MEWSAGAVARMLGISPTTLRTWDRRYGLGPSTRQEGKHRRYNDDDLARLKRMLELTGSGVSPASAAASLTPSGDLDFGAAADQLDAAQMRRVAVGLIARHGVVHTWDAVLMPFLIELGERVSSTAAGVDVEHVASGTISDAMRVSGVAVGTPAVLLACAPDEQHSLPLDVLAAALIPSSAATRWKGVPLGTRNHSPSEASIESGVLSSRHASAERPAADSPSITSTVSDIQIALRMTVA